MWRVEQSTLQSAAVQGQSMRARTPWPACTGVGGGSLEQPPPQPAHRQQPIRNFLVFVERNLDWCP